MKNKKINSEIESSLIYLIFKEKYLLIFILALSISFTILFNHKQSSKMQEINTSVFVELPTSGHELFYLTNSLLGPSVNDSTNDGFKYYRNKLSYDLISIENLINFLNLEKNLKYLKIFNKNNLDARSYLAGKFEAEIDSKFDADFLVTFFLTHPVDFDVTNFLKDYIQYISFKTKSEFINSKLKLSNEILEILNRKYEIKKEIENNSKNKNQSEKDLKILNLVDKYNNNYYSVSEIFSDLSLEDISLQIKLVNEINNKISKITFEPNFRFETELYHDQNNLIRNLLLSIIVGFVIFFSLLTFKQVFKKFLI
ncbi:hypothetical protein [Candidatus Pelagibacter sp. HIMB1593]|uniref:hypothetical protein n=1 Tax=Candidatus Pelagibacter sp. HIMB1593 TaxID=3413355 RepID=UPI003F8555F0